jgi:hypothetical protein
MTMVVLVGLVVLVVLVPPTLVPSLDSPPQPTKPAAYAAPIESKQIVEVRPILMVDPPVSGAPVHANSCWLTLKGPIEVVVLSATNSPTLTRTPGNIKQREKKTF